ncbi:MAG TPA: HIT family hydrolase, partial [Leptospiraceae bacterium]|nr:HIT family hydrolase [Leptospiraceae bacterium]
EAVPHIHWHLVPRYSDELKGFAYIQSALEGRLPEINAF